AYIIGGYVANGFGNAVPGRIVGIGNGAAVAAHALYLSINAPLDVADTGLCVRRQVAYGVVLVVTGSLVRPEIAGRAAAAQVIELVVQQPAAGVAVILVCEHVRHARSGANAVHAQDIAVAIVCKILLVSRRDIACGPAGNGGMLPQRLYPVQLVVMVGIAYRRPAVERADRHGGGADVPIVQALAGDVPACLLVLLRERIVSGPADGLIVAVVIAQRITVCIFSDGRAVLPYIIIRCNILRIYPLQPALQGISIIHALHLAAHITQLHPRQRAMEVILVAGIHAFLRFVKRAAGSVR